MSFRVDDQKLLEKYKAVWIKIEDLKSINLNVLPAYDDGYVTTKYGHLAVKFTLTFVS